MDSGELMSSNLFRWGLKQIQFLRLSGLFAVDDGQFFTTLLVSQITQHRIVGWLMDSELRRIWKEAVVAKSASSRGILPGGTKENHEVSRSGEAVSRERFKPSTSVTPPSSVASVQELSNAVVRLELKAWSNFVSLWKISRNAPIGWGGLFRLLSTTPTPMAYLRWRHVLTPRGAYYYWARYSYINSHTGRLRPIPEGFYECAVECSNRLCLSFRRVFSSAQRSWHLICCSSYTFFFSNSGNSACSCSPF
jgi:hypothetical protein